MATFAARRLAAMADNAAAVVGIELLAAAQGIEFHRPLATSPALGRALSRVRAAVPAYERDRFMAPDIAAAKALVQSGAFVPFAAGLLPSRPE